MLGHGLGDGFEEVEIERGGAPFVDKGFLVEITEVVPVVFGGGVTVELTELEAAFSDGFAFLADVLAFFLFELGEKIVESLILLIEPMELAVVPEVFVIPFVRFQPGLLFRVGEQPVNAAHIEFFGQGQCAVK